MPLECPWDGLAPATIKFCERELCGWVTQPSNTWSNIGYILVGLYLVRLAKRETQDGLGLIGVSSVIVGIGSTLFHASSTFLFEILDLLGMFLISGLLVVFNIKRLFNASSLVIYSIYSVITTISLLIMLQWREMGIPVFAIQITIAITLELLLHLRRDEVTYKNFLIATGIFSVSFLIWAADISGRLCIPDNHILTGHAVWHLLDAIAIYYLYQFYAQFRDAKRGKFSLEKANG
jgi:hypothetical protein